MIKKVVVAAAGQGTRMLQLSKNKSKHLICVLRKPFLAYLLDNILKAGYKEIILVVGFREDMVREFLKNYIATLKNYKVEDLKLMNIDDNYNYVAGIFNERPEKFGVLIEEGDDFLEGIIEKPKEFVGNLINTSLYKFTPEIFEKVFQIDKSQRGEYEITDAVSLLAKEKKVRVKKVNDFWMDFGKPEDIIKISRFLNSKYKPQNAK